MARTISLPSKSKTKKSPKAAPKKAARPTVTKAVAKKPAPVVKKASKGPKAPKAPVKAIKKAVPAKKPAAPKAAASKPAPSKGSTDFSKDPINAKLKPAEKINFLREMLRIRRFEQQALKYYNQGMMGGFLHLYIGQESVAVGTASLMNGKDEIITAYRDHGHGIAVGMEMNPCMAELLGKGTGCSQGKGGSMHYFAPDKNYWGGHGIVGGQAPLGTGLAYAVKYKGLKGCCLAYMGAGAVNQGAVHEAYNLAALWDLPMIFVIENNGYSMGTSQERSSAHPGCLAKRAEGYGMAWAVINGHDVYEVRAKTAAAVQRAHDESKPTVLEIFTYRYFGHSMADPDKTYRDKDEIKEYREKKDPVLLF